MPVTTPPVYYFNDAMRGAPVVNGQPGSIIGMLDACLITGFGLVTASTVTITAGVAKATIPSGIPHDPDSNILVAGGTDAALNGTSRVVASDATSVSWATTAASGAGTVTVKVAPVIGWSKPFSGTNIAVYKSTDPQSYGMYLRVDDTDAQNTRVVGYETMSDVNTGTGPFPTNAQMTGGGYWRKSEGNNTNPVEWMLAADSRVFYHYFAAYQGNFPATDTGSRPNYNMGVLRGFGDLASLRPAGDAYACMLCYWNTQAYNGGALLTNPASNYLALARDYTALAGSVQLVARPYIGGVNDSGIDNFLGLFPSAIDGVLRLSKVFAAFDISTPPRADFPGIYRLPHINTASIPLRIPLKTVAGLSGRSLIPVFGGSNPAQPNNATGAGRGLIDVTGPWR